MDTVNDLSKDFVEQIDTFLAHYGVKGMQWGVRKRRSSSGGASTSATPAKATPVKTGSGSSDALAGARKKDGRIAKGKGPKLSTEKTKPHVSDEELRKAINRIDMERKFAQLTAPPASKTSKAMKFAGEILADVGKQQTKALLNGIATKQLVKAGLAPPPKKDKPKE